MKVSKIIFGSVIALMFGLFSFVLYKSYLMHFSAFGCFDECFNYVAGHYILKGRNLYSEIFFNHQMLMAYLSWFIQKILKPDSIYYLVLEHRMFVFFFGLIMSVLIALRFRLAGVGFAFLFESTKFYFMGSLFLAESVLVYPLVYLFGLVWQKINGKKLTVLDYLASALFSWFILFLREPMFFVVVFLYFLINFDKSIHKAKVFSLVLFLILSLLTISLTSFADYVYQVVFVNASSVFPSEVKSYENGLSMLFKSFFYQILILIDGKWTFIREIMIGIDIIFLVSMAIFYLKRGRKRMIYILFIILGLANLRMVTPGQMFYESFHMLPWYGLFIIATFFLLQDIYGLINRKLTFLLTGALIVLIAYSLFSQRAFLHGTIDRNESFKLNFDHYYIYGQTIKYLAEPTDTIFVEGGWDDLIYWQADLQPSYKYVIYGAGGKNFPLFSEERISMFKKNPPEFYYSLHEKGVHPFGFLPEFSRDMYTELLYVDKPSGLYIKKSKIDLITDEQWRKINVLRFYL